MNTLPGGLEFAEVSFGSAVYNETLTLREAVLRAPLGLALTAADLDGEARQRHFSLREGGRLLACVVIKPAEQRTVKLRQMAVAPAARGRGFGGQLIQEVETLLRAEGVTEVVMSARQSAVGFYEKLGYRLLGAEYIELGIPHVQMHKPL